MSFTAMSVDSDVGTVDAGKHALSAFWAEHRLQQVEDALREYLGTETMADLDDVHPGDLQTLRAVQWAEARLTIAEANRLQRAVKAHHAKKHPYPEPGSEHLPRCKECACQNAADAEPELRLLRALSGSVSDPEFRHTGAGGI